MNYITQTLYLNYHIAGAKSAMANISGWNPTVWISQNQVLVYSAI